MHVNGNRLRLHGKLNRFLFAGRRYVFDGAALRVARSAQIVERFAAMHGTAVVAHQHIVHTPALRV